MSMFEGIKRRTFLSTPEEWHALVIGLFEVLCPWKPGQRPSAVVDGILNKEYHYYMAGRGAGFPVLSLILIGFAKLVKEVLL